MLGTLKKRRNAKLNQKQRGLNNVPKSIRHQISHTPTVEIREKVLRFPGTNSST
jgi:hypothetical protein